MTGRRFRLPMGAKFVDKYRILGVLGEGGSGIVYDAIDEFLDEPVALKVIPTEGTADSAERARREAKALRGLQHQNLVTIVDAGVTKDRQFVYLAMERLDGPTLRTVLVEFGMLSVPEVLTIAIQIACALEVTHRAGVIHRDLKPENIIILAGNIVKVIDFGVAKIRDRGYKTTAQNVLSGTPLYLSPEQILGEPIDGRCDVYTLGTIVFEALVGRHHTSQGNKSPTRREIIANHLGVQVPLLSDTHAHIPPEVGHIVSKMLARHAEYRYPSMVAVQKVAQSALDHYSVWAERHGLSFECRPLYTATARSPEEANQFTTEVQSMRFSDPRYARHSTLRLKPLNPASVPPPPTTKPLPAPEEPRSPHPPTIHGDAPARRNPSPTTARRQLARGLWPRTTLPSSGPSAVRNASPSSRAPEVIVVDVPKSRRTPPVETPPNRPRGLIHAINERFKDTPGPILMLGSLALTLIISSVAWVLWGALSPLVAKAVSNPTWEQLASTPVPSDSPLPAVGASNTTAAVAPLLPPVESPSSSVPVAPASPLPRERRDAKPSASSIY